VAVSSEAPGAGEGLAEDQASPVVESFESLSVQVVDSLLLAPWLGRGDIRRPASPRVLAQDAVQPAA
jgi:hypothetical protein